MTDTMDEIRKRAMIFSKADHPICINGGPITAREAMEHPLANYRRGLLEGYIEGAKSMLPKPREGYKIVAKNGHLQSGRENFYDSKEEAQEFLTILQPQSSRQLEIILLREVLEDEK